MSRELRNQIISQMQGSMALGIAFIGIANSIFTALADMGKAAPDELASKTGLDRGYLYRWCDAAFAFGLLDEEVDGRLVLTESGRAFIPDTPGTAMPFSVQSMLSFFMADRTATLMKTGERPGEKVLLECENILPLFGSMLESMFGGVFEQQILPNVPVYKHTDIKGGLVVDLGCGNGWYLRKMALHFSRLRGIGLDGFEKNVTQAARLAKRDCLEDRLTFIVGDIKHFSVSEPVDLIAMNRALHHVWDDKENVFNFFRNHLRSGGSSVIWEPNWPGNRSDLRNPSKRGMAFQNLVEHVQGNHFLRPEEIEAEFHRAGMETDVYLFADGNEAVIVGKKV